MSDYSKITNFLSKDSLSLNDPAKYVKGSEIDAECNAIAASIATKADTASPTLVTPNIGAATGTSLVLSGLATVNGAFTSLGLDDNATAKALTLSGSGANSVTIANSATSPTIGTSNGDLFLTPAGDIALRLAAIAGTVANYIAAIPSATIDPLLSSNTGSLFLGGASGAEEVRVVNTGASVRHLTLTGAIAGGNPTIGTSGGQLDFNPAGQGVSFRVGTGGLSTVNFVTVAGAPTGGRVTIFMNGADTNVGSSIQTKGTGSHLFVTESGASAQVEITHTASADRYITLTGSNGGNPTIGTSGGDLKLTANTNIINVLGALVSTLQVYANNQTATPAGGAVNTGVFLGSAGIGIFFGSGAPTVSAVKGSIYLRSNGSTTNDRMYINTDGNTTWTAVTTAA